MKIKNLAVFSLLPLKIKRLIGLHFSIDSTVFFSLLNRFWSLSSGLITLWFVANFLSPTNQGFYYTFFSLVSVQILFELGLTYTLTQFIAHEMASLTLTTRKRVVGNLVARMRLFSIVQQSAKWFTGAAIIFMMVAVIAGYFLFMKSYSNDINKWLFPLLSLSVLSGFKLIITAFEGLIEGIGLASFVAKTRIYSSIVGSIALWTGLTFNGGLYAPSIMTLCALVFCLVRYITTFKFLILDLIRKKVGKEFISWRNEIWPLQWRMALSWGSGYFIYQAFNPIIFYYQGAIAAGQFGMAMMIINSIMSICSAWITPKVATITTITAQENHAALRSNFASMMKSSVLIAIIMSIGISLLLIFGKLFDIEILNRFPSIQIIIFLLIGVILNQVVSVIALFIRAKKIDPYASISITSAILTLILLVLFIPTLGLYGAVISYLAPTILIVLPASIFFYTKYLNFKGIYEN